MKKVVLPFLVALILSFFGMIAPPIARANTTYDPNSIYYFQNVGYNTSAGRVGFVTDGAPSTYTDQGVSTVVVSASAYYDRESNLGFERGRVWGRPQNVRGWMCGAAYFCDGPDVIKAVLQYQSSDSNLWIDGSDPVANADQKFEVPGYIFTIIGAVNKTGVPVGDILGMINGFTYSATKVSFPDNTTNKHYVEFYNWTDSLPGMTLEDQYTYKEADLASSGHAVGASAVWKYSLRNKNIYNYNVNVVGRVMYETYNQDMYGNWYWNYAWSGLAQAPHIMNRN